MSGAAGSFAMESARALEFLDNVLGDLEHDKLDVELSGDVLKLSFDDGSTFIINAHSAAQQVWMAAGTTAWHFDYDPKALAWIASRTDDELMSTVALVVGEKLGEPIAF